MFYLKYLIFRNGMNIKYHLILRTQEINNSKLIEYA